MSKGKVTLDEATRTPQEHEIVRLRDEITRLRALIRDEAREDLTEEKIRELYFGLSSATIKPPDWLLKPQTPDSPGTPVVIFSDWHWGERVDYHHMGRANRYNAEIAEARARRVTQSTVDLGLNLLKTKRAPGGIVVCLGGDMVSGNIHEELEQTNDTPITQVMHDLCAVLVWSLSRLADAFGKVYVPCVYGNHGRLNPKKQFKGQAGKSLDWLLYTLLEAQFKADRRVTFQIPTGIHAPFEVNGVRCLLTHGDQIGGKGGDGIIGPIGPIMRGVNKLRNNDALPDFDLVIMGHFHRYMHLPNVVVNGSLVGYNEYALGQAMPFERPVQALFFIHHEYKATVHIPLYADKGEKA